jgi:hypothetical protein
MVVRFVLWNLSDTSTTIDQLREYLRDESVAAFADVKGLLFKTWISDEATERWGAIYVWSSRSNADQPLPSRAAEIIGKPPDVSEWFDVDATVSVAEELDRRGIALED